MPSGIYNRNAVTVKPIPTMKQIMHLYLDPEKRIIERLLDMEILEMPEVCIGCGNANTFRFKDKKQKTIRCAIYGCRHSQSLLKGTFFANGRPPAGKVIEFLYHYLVRNTHSSDVTTSICKKRPFQQ